MCEQVVAETAMVKNETKLCQCDYCGREFFPEISENTCDVSICEQCLNKNLADVIIDYCQRTRSKKPVDIATHLMKFPTFKMHCPDHHLLVPAALLSAYCNVNNKRRQLRRWLKLAKARAQYVPGAFCGTHGACGAAIGTGLFMSIITGATPLKTFEWELANSMTGRSLLQMAPYGGPRCCKRVSFIAIIEAVRFVNERLDGQIPVPENIHCTFSERNTECLKSDCPFWQN